MKKQLILILAASMLLPLAAHAGPYTDALGNCLTDSTTGKERKELARWIFVAISSHPDIQDLSRADASVKEQSNRFVAQLLTRLIAESCINQTRAAYATEGGESLKNAFGTLGKVAMQELMTNANVNAAIVEFEKYVDQKKLAEAFAPK